ncbi:MAG TPA: hypothetical protein VMW19_12540 [Myxococcota bacterium]|nr:hypothetical protein [Myxococcota bacterium]
MALSAAHRRLLLVDNGVGAAAFNFALNGAIAWLLFRSVTHVPLWGGSSVAGDTLVTAFLLPFLTCLIVTRLVARQVAEGRIPRLSEADRTPSSWSRRSPLSRGALLGAASVVLAALPVVAALALSGSAGLALWSFIGFKAAFAACLAAIVTPLVAWWALLRASG